MPTQIFASYADFLLREDKTINGVHETFAQVYPYWEKYNTTNTGCWNCKYCKKCTDCINCTECFKCTNCTDSRYCTNCTNCITVASCRNCTDCKNCVYCIDCTNCLECSYCKYCNDNLSCRACTKCESCRDCERCENCKDCITASEENGMVLQFDIPVIPSIHQKVLKAINLRPNALNMGAWHSCSTTHCRAGWVVVIAGEDGEALENKVGTAFAALMIYKASSTIPVLFKDFYAPQLQAIEDIERCAELERNLPATV